uniref:Nucleotide-diphospho-sugar transferase domain-containing protein n=1 Tax=Haptolina brevifila TaxID=156173 RepID=A0A7S2IBE3_9EUKA|mmetsp:Transcript_64144/g.126738  ORF Transcript_64144/g.126738 Transcript_64144/m.126738 type:complete len:406 (+) Transcript_64144:196-1413(+)
MTSLQQGNISHGLPYVLPSLIGNPARARAWWQDATSQVLSTDEPVVMTALDSAYVPFLRSWRLRMAQFGLRQAVVIAFDENVVRNRVRSLSSLSVATEARRLRMVVLPYKHAVDLSGAPGLDALGRELGEKDIAIWQCVALLLSVLGEHGRVLFTEMDVFWVKTPVPLLDSLSDRYTADTLLCSSAWRIAKPNECNIGMLAMRGSRDNVLARSFACAASRWLTRGSTLGSHGQKAFNRVVQLRMCNLAFQKNASLANHQTAGASVFFLPPEEHTSNQPHSQWDNPNWGPISLATTASVHLTAMCWEKCCGAETGGAKLAVLTALYDEGVWPSRSTYFWLADLHRPMVSLLAGTKSAAQVLPSPMTLSPQLTEGQLKKEAKQRSANANDSPTPKPRGRERRSCQNL